MSYEIDELAARLFRLEAGSRHTAAVTREITAAVVGWALSCGWFARAEARVDVPIRLGMNPRLGIVDVVISRGGEAPDIAIEIDSGDKRWSVKKLQYLARIGMRAVWIRWGDDAWAGVIEGVDVIQLRLVRRPARAGPAAQLALWR